MKRIGTTVLALLMLTILSAPRAMAADVYLVAKAFTAIMPDGASVPMWGFATDADGNLSTIGGETPSSPGPFLTVPPNDTTLNIHLRNDLAVPVSIVIPGLYAPLSPVRFTDGSGRSRVQSFTTETGPGATRTYTWANVSPGTYMYQSGTHPAVQVQMGLYGGVKKNASASSAYDGVAFDREVSLFLSEIDPLLHEAVSTGQYGSEAYPGVVGYRPRYFLVNGKPYSPADANIYAGAVNEKVLLRMLNAGMEAHAPLLQGQYFDVVAENGKAYSHKKRQYTALVPAGSTADAIMTAAAAGTYPVYDRRLFMTNKEASPGGMLAYLEVSASSGLPVSSGDAYSVNEDAALSIAAPGVLANDSSPLSAPLTVTLDETVKSGSLTLNSNGSFIYTPSTNFNGADFFTYRASDGTRTGNIATVTLTVNPVNDRPVATADSVQTNAGAAVNINVLANDTDVDNDALSISSYTNGTKGSVAPGSGTLVYTPNAGATGIDTFSYMATDGALVSDPATVTVTINQPVNQPPVAVDDSASTRRNVAVTINVLSNDYDPDGSLSPSTVQIVTAPTRGGTASVIAGGNVVFTPKRGFRGTDVFTYTVKDNNGAISNAATVRVNVR